MFPLKDMNSYLRVPYITWLIIIVNICIFGYIYFNNISSLIILDLGIVPAKFGMPSDIVSFYEKLYPFVTYQFIHSNWIHLLSNIYFLYIFGNGVEDKLGHMAFLFFYICFGIIAGIIQTILMPILGIPIVGASGAVAGILGAYIIFYPNAKIKTLLIIIIFITIVKVPAMIFIIIWFIYQLIWVLADSFKILETNTALWGHLGGFIAGMVLGIIIRFLKNNKKVITLCV